jgi:hypothetical protein
MLSDMIEVAATKLAWLRVPVFQPAKTHAYIIFGAPLDSPTQIVIYSNHMGVGVTVNNLNVVNNRYTLCGTDMMPTVEKVF